MGGCRQPVWIASVRDTIEELVFLPEQEIFAQGDIGDAMYLVREGTVTIWVGEASNPTILASLANGSIFGEAALMNGAPRMAHARSGPRGCVVVMVPRAAFLAKMEKSDPMVVAVARLLIDTMRTANGEVSTLKKKVEESELAITPLRTQAATLRPEAEAVTSQLDRARRENAELRKIVVGFIEQKKAKAAAGATKA